MIGWLSDWLRDIIAVILLAVLVELLLPNKAMQRYARLVVGLFILLTLLSPILRLIQEDFGDRLDAGMQLWNERSMERKVQMPSLEEIAGRAEELQERRALEALQLTKRTLESAMAEELHQQAALDVHSVNVELRWVDAGKSGKPPEIGGVTVTLAPPREPDTGEAEEDRSAGADKGIPDVEPVSVAVVVEAIDGEAVGASGTPSGNAGGKKDYVAAREGDATAAWGVLKQGWGVSRDKVAIRQLAAYEQ